MSELSEGSVRGRGREEMVPERGDPFAFEEGEPRDLTAEELAELYPEGLERSVDRVAMGPAPTEAEEQDEPRVIGPPVDHGLGAVGPPLAEDVFPEEAALEEAEMPEIPLPPPDEAMPMAGRELSGSGFRIPSPTSGMAEGPKSEALAADHELVSFLVPDEQLRMQWDWANRLRDRVYGEIDNLHLANQLLDQLERARNQLMSSRENYEEAERMLSGVEYRIHHAARVRMWSGTVGNRLLLYELVWALAIVVGMMFLPGAVASYVTEGSSFLGSDLVVDVTTAVTTLLWGGLGGVVGALAALRTHIARDQDFDRQWSIWYVTNPLMGIVLGAFVFLVVRAGLFALLPGSEARIESTWLVYAFAWLAGFQQNVAYDLVERVVRIFAVDRPSTASPDEE